VGGDQVLEMLLRSQVVDGGRAAIQEQQRDRVVREEVGSLQVAREVEVDPEPELGDADLDEEAHRSPIGQIPPPHRGLATTRKTPPRPSAAAPASIGTDTTLAGTISASVAAAARRDDPAGRAARLFNVA